MNLFTVGLIITLVTGAPVLWQLRKHPKGLFILFFAEMWERFSYYGMRGLLVFYLTQHFLFSDDYSQGQYAAYTSLVYLLPVIGGFIADRFLGTRKAIVFGSLLLVAGHGMMAIEGAPAKQLLQYGDSSYEFAISGRSANRQVRLMVDGAEYEFGATETGDLEIKDLPVTSTLPSVLAKGSYELTVEGRDKVDIFFLALALIIMGVGFLKANISSIVGQLYTEHDPRRDPGFTLYYYGINLGAFWSALLCGWLGMNVGWWAGFGLAGLGMLLGLVVFILGKPLLEGHGEPPKPEVLKEKIIGPINREWWIYILGILGVGVVWLLVQRQEIVGWMLAIGTIGVLGYLFWFMFTQIGKVQRERMLLALIMVAAATVFWTMFEQAGSSMNLFAQRNTELLYGVTAAQTQSFNAGFILLMAPLFSFIWAWLGSKDKDLSIPMKFAWSLILVGLGFLFLVWGGNFANDAYRVPMIFLAGAYLLHTMGELFMSPVGLSMITRLSAAAVVSTMMAVWFLASSFAQYLGGMIAKMTSSETVAGQVLDPKGSLETYLEVFQMIGIWAIGIGIFFMAISFFIKKWSHDEADVNVDGFTKEELKAKAASKA
ncbi:MAG: MFS transporter [Robiginitomaculum sp.]|nr:MAG: MFS transporter [Robiginitomaculum sp.]